MTDSASKSASGASPPQASNFRAFRILVVAVPLVLIILGAFYLFAYQDGAGWLRELFSPRLVAGSGKVYFGDQPLDGGEVRTAPVGSDVTGAVGFIKEDGTFEFVTDIRGDFKPGIFVGEHKVTVVKRENATSPALPPPLTPEQYASFGTTPLTIVVDKSPDKNVFEFRLEKPAGDNSPSASGAARPGGGAGRGPSDPQEFIRQTLEQYDKNDDGALSFEEMEAAGFGRRNLSRGDTNGDGAVDADELAKLAEEVTGTRLPTADSTSEPAASDPAETDPAETDPAEADPAAPTLENEPTEPANSADPSNPSDGEQP
jgi:hypothetical protein